MASKSNHIRSNSFPSRSHPATLRVEQVLNKIKTSELSSVTSESICYGLCRLAELYQCMDDLLNLSSTIQSLSQQNSQKFDNEFLDGSMKILDICGITRDIVSQFKENVRDLQSSLRRRKGDSSIESSLDNYTCFRKKMKKDAKRSIAALKQLDQANIEDEHISSVIGVLREVNSTTVAIFQSILIFLSAQSKSSKWRLVSRLVHKESEERSQNELEEVDSALKSLCGNDQSQIQFVQNRLESVEARIDGIESGLESLFRKKMKKDAKRSIAALRQLDQVIIDEEQNSSVIRVLREVNSTTVSILESVLIFLAASKPKSSKWAALVSRLVNNSKVGCEDQESQNELESADSALQSLCTNDQSETEKIQFIQNRLESLDASIDGIENGLVGLYRLLIRSRTSLLNIFSC
ncbi:OLC1v1011163C1 [Oldenlandia corymbosa var. corymbosa]|uniref:OLC1v1011163C1 n=1 Tax=Oldenlandia corymbosa var. corymbosa TaxID=529605 RepID=A0AAV1DSY2_OLDCO|nr:OLC1v1011163C1 [Oldenlandia corymbosa var. corymbosa]